MWSFFQIRDKEKSNGQLREELGGVLEKNKNIMEEVDNRKHPPYSVFFSSSFSLVMYLNRACFIFSDRSTRCRHPGPENWPELGTEEN